MSNATYFLQDCPTCGRRLQIRVEFLGRQVACQHCRGRFVACDPATRPGAEGGDSVLQRAEQLLKTSPRGVVYARYPEPF
ncbi:MAG TPA: hypothetical protein EYP56_09915 [Planctomycetaceae bacterium]|nr:hypothetical protein [Planctomycetaceae bacterium]